MAASYVMGLQSANVASSKKENLPILMSNTLKCFRSTAIKHFVGNDQEHERTAADSVMTDRALREVYLYPWVFRSIY
jgi:beta-glucosidase